MEDALTKTSGTILDFCPEYQGEAIAFEPGGKGFYTTTEINKRNASHTFAPIYYYSFSKANVLKSSFFFYTFFFIVPILSNIV